MRTIHLVFGVHWHAPLGYSDHEFEAVYQDTYKHFLSTLYEVERLPVVLHYSGIVLEFLEKNHPEYLNLLDEMVKRKQVELLGGGFYDPVLPIIPLIDKIGQLELCTTYLRSHFGKRPRGAWLPEQVWESTLPNTLRSCGLEYTFLNETAFKNSHCAAEDIFYPHLTEEQGKNVIVFPLALRLKELLFTKSPKEVITWLKRQASPDGDRVVSLLIDGECYTRGLVLSKRWRHANWLKEFFARLLETNGVICPVVPQEYLKTRSVTRKTYFSSTFSRSVFRAALPARAVQTTRERRSARRPDDDWSGTNFKQIFTKYRESSLLYAKMMYTHLTVQQMRGDKSRKTSALEELWRGQCHYAYWHDSHLGIYDNALRKEVYRSLINAEKYTRTKGSFLSSIITADFDFDGESEHLYQSNELNVYIHRQNGMIYEMDYLPVSWNYADSLSRIREAYHGDDDGAVDRYPRKAFIEHFFKYRKNTAGVALAERILDLCACPGAKYELKELKREQRQISFLFEGLLDGQRKKSPVSMEKQYAFKKNTIVVGYRIKNPGERKTAFHFGVELNLSFSSPLKENLRLYDASKKTNVEIDVASGDRVNVKKATIEDRLHNVAIDLSFIKPCSLQNHLLVTRARAHGKIGEQFQALCLFPAWEIELEPEEVWEGALELSIQRMT
jgi:4-alpha-glucanotransferase